MACLKKIWIKELNGNVTFGQEIVLVAEIAL
jgi:hypothetical protein